MENIYLDALPERLYLRRWICDRYFDEEIGLNLLKL